MHGRRAPASADMTGTSPGTHCSRNRTADAASKRGISMCFPAWTCGDFSADANAASSQARPYIAGWCWRRLPPPCPRQDERGAGAGVLGCPEGSGHVAEHEPAGGDAVGWAPPVSWLPSFAATPT
jgi:hypothetical protein